MDATKMEAADFRGIESELFMCEGARVLLTQNLWVEAGLMNGALGVVKGFVFPEKFDPKSDDPALRKPLCVVVKFDDVNLPEDLKLKGAGMENCVPIFHETAFHESEEKVSRKQFPLTLAWCLTHWKAQGMTLLRVKIALGEEDCQEIPVPSVRVAGLSCVSRRARQKRFSCTLRA